MNRQRRVCTGRLAMTIIVASGCRRNELALGSPGGKCNEQHTESSKCGDLHVSPPRRESDRRIALSHISLCRTGTLLRAFAGTQPCTEAVFQSEPNQQRT